MNKVRCLSFCSFLGTLAGNCLLSSPAFAAEMPNESKMGLAWGIPIAAIVHPAAGVRGSMGGLIGTVNDASGRPIDWAYFAICGTLSAFLGNAPTYLEFFNAAGGDPVVAMGAKAMTLTAISAGAAFWGGVTYIGNAPNLMAKSISEQHNIRIPNFLGYMAWSGTILLPSLALTAWVFFR